MALAYHRVLINEFLNKYPDIVPEEEPLLLFYSNYFVCMANNGKDTNHTIHIARRVHFVRNGEKYKFHKSDWCEGGLQMADISIINVRENYLNPIIRYSMVRLDK